MIIILPATKDTYVSNLKTQNIDAIKSNVGHAATLDLFKLYNENKNAKSSAVLKFNTTGNPAGDDQEFILQDALGNSVTFIVKTGLETKDGSLDADGKVIIGLSGKVISDYADVFRDVINLVSEFNNGLTLNITAFSNSNNELVLKQDNPGASGDTNIVLPNGINYVSIISNSTDSFSRKDMSAIILDFDFLGFKSEFMSNVIFAESAFNSLKAEIVLHDVSTGQTKPRNYTLSAYNLKKDFDEGIGKDTIHFSDLDEVANFTNLNDSNSFQIPGHISLEDDISILDHPDNDGSEVTPTFSIVKGNEDAVFDITDYFKNQVKNTPDNKGILITFDDATLNNEKTYFVKRFGSRHLINKSLVPILKISVPDSDFTIPKKSQFAKRYLNNTEVLYLFNRSNSLKEFSSPANSTLKLKVISEDKLTIYLDDVATNDVISYKGETITGVKKAEISNTSLDRFSSTISQAIKNEKLTTYINWYWDNGTDEFLVKEEKIIFNTPENSDDQTYSNLVSRVKFENTKLSGDNKINEGHAYFLDTRSSLEVVKVPFDILSENLGEVKYQLINIDNNKIIYDYSDSTKLFYDGEKYVFNFCLPEIYKNFRVKFNFKVINQINDNEYIIKNKEVFRIE